MPGSSNDGPVDSPAGVEVMLEVGAEKLQNTCTMWCLIMPELHPTLVESIHLAIGFLDGSFLRFKRKHTNFRTCATGGHQALGHCTRAHCAGSGPSPRTSRALL